MNKKIYIIISAACCTVLAISMISTPVLAASPASLLGSFLEENSGKEKENIYVITDSTGSATKIYVSENEGKAETYSDIDSLPIKITAKYTLDGKEIEASEIKGATGKLTVRYDYENTVKKGKYHVPFTVATGMILPQDEFENIEISNGKIEKDGNNALVIGMAYPSLSEDLGIKSDDLRIYDYVELTADVKNASWNNVYTIVSNTVFSALGSESAEDSEINEDSIKELIAGIGALSDGSGKLADGLNDLSDGANQLTAGVNTLSSGLSTLSANSAQLNGGAAMVFNSILNTANEEIAKTGAPLPALTIDNYSMVLTMAIQSLNLAGDSANAAALTGLKGQLDSYNTFYQGLLKYTAGVDNAAGGAKKLGASVPALTSGVGQLKDGAEQLSDGINELSEKTVGKLSGDDVDTADLVARLKDLSKLAKDYTSYVGTAKDEGIVRFVYKIGK